MLTFSVAPAPDAVFALQAVNDQYNSFWRSFATALFYVRTGVNLGYGAPPISKRRFDSRDSSRSSGSSGGRGTDILASHPTPNHYVQECLANWLEFYVGTYAARNPLKADGTPKEVLRGDFVGICNDGETFPPLKALLKFLEDWYAGASIRFLAGDLSASSLEDLDEFMRPYTETLDNFITPATCDRLHEALAALERLPLDTVVGYSQMLLVDCFPEERRGGGVLGAATPQIIVMEVEKKEGEEPRIFRHSAYTAVAQGTSIVAMPPDLSYYRDRCTVAYGASCQPMWADSSLSLGVVLAPDRIVLYRTRDPESSALTDYGSFSVLFPLVGSAPTFADRGYCQRVTEDVLRELFPSIEEGQIRTFLSHLYPGRRVEEPRFSEDALSVPPRPSQPTAIHLSEEGAFSGEPKAHLVVPFSDSTWHKVQPAIETILDFFKANHFVLENSTDIYVAERVAGKAGDVFRAKLRLYSEDATPKVFGCEPMSQILQEPLEDLSRDPKIGLFFSTADTLAIGLGGSRDTDVALARCARASLGDYALNYLFGDSSLIDRIVRFNKEDHSYRRVSLDEGRFGLRGPSATYLLFEPSDWMGLEDEIEVLDNSSRYTLCMHMPASEVGEDRNVWIVGERDVAAESGDDLVFSSVRPLLASDGEEEAETTFCLDDDMGIKDLRVAKDDVEHASSSLHKAIIFNLLHVHLFKYFAGPKEREAMQHLLEASKPFRYAEGPLADRVVSDARDVGMAL
jgi:hypothetical protein